MNIQLLKSLSLIITLITVKPNLIAQKGIRIESLQSVFIELFKDSNRLGSATGFIIRSNSNKPYLITNWHVVTNKSPVDKSWLNPKIKISPNRIKIHHNGKVIGSRIPKFEKLNDERNNKLYTEFKIGKEMVDMIALPLLDTVGTKIYPVNYKQTYESITIEPTDRVFILGFPLGFSNTALFPIWKSGMIASEPYIEQENKPIIYIDAFGYGGMSGSPVYMITDKPNFTNGNMIYNGQTYTLFMGIFSHSNSKIGVGALWSSEYLKELFKKLK